MERLFLLNKVFSTGSWPRQWKDETAVIIPKVPNPTSLSQCRNISCTSILSKVLEMFVLEDLRSEIPPDACQYGGLKGSSVDHLLVDLWDQILRPMESSHHSIILGIDYEKAFNHLSHQVCLEELTRLGASEATVSLVRTFLTERRVRVRLPCGTLSEAMQLMGGSPQDSILRCLLYRLATQQIDTRLAERGGVRDDPGTPPNAREQEREEPHSSDTSADGFGLLEEEMGRSPDGTDDDDRSPHPPVQPQIQVMEKEVWTIVMFKYIDDTTSVENIPPDQSIKHFTTATNTETLPALATLAFLNGAVDRSKEIGTKINCTKTQVLCISTDNRCRTTVSLMVDGQCVRSEEAMKLLVYYLGSSPDANAQFDNIRRKFRGRFWSLIHLRKAGIKGMKLYKLYCVFVRTVIETNCVIYHCMLTNHQSNEIEKMQKRVL